MKRLTFPLLNQRFSGKLLQTSHITQSDANCEFVDLTLKGAIPMGTGDINWPHAQAMPLCILHQSCRRIKAHGLVVENRRRERGQVANLEKGAGIGKERK